MTNDNLYARICRKSRKSSVENNIFDLVIGGLAIAILAGGLLMLFTGIFAFKDQDKQ
ncbi:MAG: hypothetical protein RID53_32600 [Coleofasciculus sp. B1-GNL1-01]|uniref:hypothetical protein n=1 Tax=Coleofasciculus sp. B1-GNL1-01 TaxID=3068484 RepID=UPI00330072C4